MNKRSIRYKDTWAAPGSRLHAALEDGNKKLAEQIYQDCEKDRAKLESKGSRVALKPVDHDLKGQPIYDPTQLRVANTITPIPGVNV